jgi:hypothetical protein
MIQDIKLSEFTQDQQRLMLRLVIAELADLRAHVQALQNYESIASLMDDSIREYESQIEDLNTLVTQFAGAVVKSIEKERISSN